MPKDYVVVVLRDKLSGIPAGPGVLEPFPYSDHPILPPKNDEIELWQFYFKKKYELRAEDVAILIPIRDSGKSNPGEDYKLFTAEEQMFWSGQISYVVLMYKTYLESFDEQGPRQPQSITNVVSGTHARVNVNSTDYSVNVTQAEASDLFEQLRARLDQIDDDSKREEVAMTVDEMESAYDSDSFLQRYKEFMASVADHTTVFAPLFPALANLLSRPTH